MSDAIETTAEVNGDMLSHHEIEVRLDRLDRLDANREEQVDTLQRGVDTMHTSFKRIMWAHPVSGGSRHVRNAAAAVSLLMAAAGLWMVTPALALIVVGFIVFGGTIAGMVLTRPKGEQEK